MAKIFRHKDGDNDELEVLLNRDRLRFMAAQGHASSEVDLDRDAVLRLHAALGEWLYPVHTPEWANKSLIEQMIEKAVADQVAAVLPLHLKPFAMQMQAAEEKIGRVANALMSDPEPHDVGHADEPTDHGRLMSELPRRMRPRPICVSCGHGWGEHTSGVCWGTSQTPEGVGCVCTRERPGTAGTP